MSSDSPAAFRTHVTRGLRFRLTTSYVLFFTALLSFLGLFFVETLRSIYGDQVRDLLDEEWGAIKGYLRIEKGKPAWFYDREDPDEAFVVERLRRVYFLADAEGRVLEVSNTYREFGIDPPDAVRAALRSPQPAWRVRRNEQGIAYIIRSGVLVDGRHRMYMAIGRSLAEGSRLVDRFAWTYFLVLPLMILSGWLIGWLMAGRALRPLEELARTAQRITGSNLAVQIPTRGAGDELDRLIEAFNRMTERLDSSFRQTRQFSTDVSHELRTPLTAIRGQLEVALFAATSTEQYREAIVNALQDVERLSQIVRALLLLAQSESGQLALQKQVLEISALAREVADQLQIPAEAAGVRLSVSAAPACLLEADRVQMERLLSNLLANAVKYTPAGGSVSVAVRCRRDEVRIVVDDTGVGIAADHLPHIFDRFYRIPSTEKDPERGLGLGLSFVAWIVRAHGGSIDVQSKPGEGTRFTVRLPAGNVREPAPMPALEPQRKS